MEAQLDQHVFLEVLGRGRIWEVHQNILALTLPEQGWRHELGVLQHVEAQGGDAEVHGEVTGQLSHGHSPLLSILLSGEPFRVQIPEEVGFQQNVG